MTVCDDLTKALEESIQYMKKDSDIRYRSTTPEERIKGIGEHRVVVRVDEEEPNIMYNEDGTECARWTKYKPGTTLPKEHYFEEAAENYEEKFEKTFSGALKDTKGKPDITLMPLEILKCFVGPLTYGQMKGYPKNNWLQGIPFTKSLRAALSHLTEWQNGVDLDEEALEKKNFEMRHIDAALFHIASIALMTRRGKGDLDDR